MLDPKQLFLIDSKEKVRLLLINFKDKLIDIGIYELLTDWLWENFSNQKRTLKNFDYHSKDFVDGSTEWQKWTHETTNHNSSEASYSEEIWTTLSLWFEQGLNTEKRYQYLLKNSNSVKGVMSGARFAIFDHINADNIKIPIDVQKQGIYIDTLQHERIHLFCRYYKVLKYDIPFASALGLILAQLHLSGFGYNYNNWISAKRYFRNNHRISGSHFQQKKVFLESIKKIKRRYVNQKEYIRSYIDGHNLAISSAEYFQSLSNARIFLELLCYGVKINEAHDISISEPDYINIYRKNQVKFYVYGEKINNKQRLGLWNPDVEKTEYLCAIHSLKLTSYAIRNIFQRNNISNLTLAEIIGLRGADQNEAQHFQHDQVNHTFKYLSLPYSLYTAKPLVTKTCLKVHNLLKSFELSQKEHYEFLQILKRTGYNQMPSDQELDVLTCYHISIKHKWNIYKRYSNIWKQDKVNIVNLITDDIECDV